MRKSLTNLFERWTAGDRRPVALLFGLIAWPASWFYRAGLLFTSTRRKTYTRAGRSRLVVISSPLVGGVGKTPLVILLTNNLVRQHQQRVAVVTMGYGRVSNSRAIFHNTAQTSIQDVGDEGKEIGWETGVPVHSGPEPAAVIRELEQSDQFDWIVFDDGVSRSWERERRVIVMSADALDRPVRYLPFGRWRVSPRMLSRAAYVAVTESDAAADHAMSVAGVREWGHRGPVGWFTRRVNGLRRWLSPEQDSEAEPPVGSAYLYCGIARPHRFVAAARNWGVDIAGVNMFPDHHNYTPDDLAHLRQKFHESGARWWLTTLKDVMRTRPDWSHAEPLYYLSFSLAQVGGDDLISLLNRES